MPSKVADLIRADHREFERMFAELRRPPQRPLLAPVLVALLSAHARAEEAHIYPALREDTNAGEKVAHSQEEHVEADELAARLVRTNFEDPSFDELLDELVKSVAHHLEEEESDVLPRLDELPDEEQLALATAFLERRADHLCAGVADLSKAELQQQAANEGIENAASMTKSQLATKVRS